MHSPSISVLGVPIAQVDYDQMLNLLREWILERSKEARTVVAANVHVVTEAALDKDYRTAILNADMILPDGMPLVWATHLLGGKLADRCYGPTLMKEALHTFQPDRVRHALYGATQETLTRLCRQVNTNWPQADIVAALPAPFGAFEDRVEHDNIDIINKAKPDMVWICMGCPKQELWMHRYRSRVDSAAMLAVGAAFDFIAGVVPQSPAYLQRLGLEWLFRFACEPRRLWKRYLFRNPYFVFQFLLQLLRLRWR